MTDRKKPGVTFWASAALVLVLAYPLSFGPATWLVRHSTLPGGIKVAIWSFYSPVNKAINWAATRDETPACILTGIARYLDLCD